jgi:Rrf2 family protein
MRFTTRITYGLKAILVLASRYGEGSLSVSQIAKREGISVAYLEQILNALKRKGLVKSVRGPQGGYILSKKPSEITLESLFYSLEDKGIAAIEPKINISPETDEATVANFIFWKKFKSSIEKGLGELTLKDLIDESRRVKKLKPQANFAFHI